MLNRQYKKGTIVKITDKHLPAGHPYYGMEGVVAYDGWGLFKVFFPAIDKNLLLYRSEITRINKKNNSK